MVSFATKSLVACAGTLLLASTALTQQTAEARSVSYDLNIPAEPLDSALQALALSTNHKLFYRAELVAGKASKELNGTYTTEEAVTKLLEGTKLSFEITPASVVLIKGPEDKSAANLPASTGGSVQNASSGSSDDASTATKEGRDKKSRDFRVAQVDQGTVGPSAIAKNKEGSDAKKKSDLEEIVVTGSRIPTTAQEQVQPLRRYTRDDIATSGQSTVGDFLNTLPGVSTFQLALFDVGYAGLQSVQLHGLPVGTTLTLLNGQRVETSTNGFFDLSNIPLAAVDRIEVLPVGASAIYGANALAGAVNFVLRNNFNGFEVNANITHGADVTDKSANFAWGKSWARGSVSLIGTYQQQGDIRGDQREPTSFTSFPGDPAAGPALLSDQCNPGTVYSTDGSNLPGLPSSMAAIPAGITGVPTLQQFYATAGKQNVCSGARFRDLAPHVQREGALLSARFNLTDSAELFTDVLFSHRSLRSLDGPLFVVSPGYGFGSLAANNPYNPFGVPVNVSFAYPGSGVYETQSAYLIRPLVGLRGALTANWQYEFTTFFLAIDLRTIDSMKILTPSLQR